MRIEGLYPIVDLAEDGTPESAAAFLDAVCVDGVVLAQLRAKKLADRRFLAVAERCAEIARARGVILVVNDRADIAAAAGAGGVHVGSDDLPPRIAKGLLPRGAIVGVSSDSPAEARDAASSGADYVAWGAVFPTATKTDAARQDGPGALAAVRAAIPGVPLVAIGGITLERVPAVVRAGADAFAVIGALRDAQDPREAARAMVAAWRDARR